MKPGKLKLHFGPTCMRVACGECGGQTDLLDADRVILVHDNACENGRQLMALGRAMPIDMGVDGRVIAVESTTRGRLD